MSEPLFEGLTFKVADAAESAHAIALRDQVYKDDVGYVPTDDLDARSYHLIACDRGGDVVAAFRIVGPDQRPFEIEQYVNLFDVIEPDRSPALIGRLCVRRDYRKVRAGTFVQIGLLKLTYDFALKRGFTDLFMYTFTHLLKFYRGAFFKPLNISFHHSGYGCRMHLMHLDLIGLQDQHSKSKSSLARLLFAKDLPNFVV